MSSLAAAPAIYDLQTFGLKEMIHAGRALRALGGDAHCMEHAAKDVVNFFYDRFLGKSGRPACALARCFKTHKLDSLPSPLRRNVLAVPAHSSLPGTTPCLSLLATRGLRPEWNSRHASNRHQAIPLASVAMVAQAPMIDQLFAQLGLALEDIVHPQLHLEQQSTERLTHTLFDVFHVPYAPGSPMVPDQSTFVEPYGIVSVLGFGGLLPDGALFAVILFTTDAIAPDTAALFRTLALSVKLHLLPFSGKQVFAEMGQTPVADNEAP